jgi:hypothetical protein
VVSALTLIGAVSPSVPDIMYAHTTALRHLRDFLELHSNVFGNDPGTEIQESDVFATFLEVCQILLWAGSDRIEVPEEDKKHVYSYGYWATKHDQYSTEVVNLTARVPMKALMPLLIERLTHWRKVVIDAAYYWSHRNPTYLTLVYNTALPDKTDDTTLEEWACRYNELARPPAEDISSLIGRVRRKGN